MCAELLMFYRVVKMHTPTACLSLLFLMYDKNTAELCAVFYILARLHTRFFDNKVFTFKFKSYSHYANKLRTFKIIFLC